jgi:RNA polymerase sigma factor (sigma-70 family)
MTTWRVDKCVQNALVEGMTRTKSALPVVGQRPTAQDKQDDLIAAAQRGDLAATGRVAEMFLPLCAAAAREAGAPSSLLEDAIAEGVCGLYRALRSYDPSRNRPFAAYARVVVRRWVAAWLASEACAFPPGTVSIDAPLEGLDVESLHDVLPSDAMIDDEHVISGRLGRALAGLPDADRHIVLRRAAGDTHETIATDLGVARQAVQQHEARAHRLLRAAVSP